MPIRHKRVRRDPLQPAVTDYGDSVGHMAEWTWQAWIGLIGGTAIFFAVLVPALLIQVRRYGQVSVRRLFGAAAVSVYAVALVAYTLLPLPAARANCSAGGGAVELIPAHSFADIARETAGLSLLSTLTSHATLQVVMNVALFIPFGIIARRYWSRGPLVSILLGALVSLAIEATQGTGIWGIYECAYRVADIDDVIANTAGAAIGVLVAPILLAWMPSSRALRADRGAPRRITTWRRYFGMALDSIIIQFSISLLSLCFLLPRLVAAGGRGPAGPQSVAEVIAIGAGTVVLVVVLPALIGDGASLGQRLVWIAPRWPRARASAGRRLYRAGAVAVPYIASLMAQQLPGAESGQTQTVAGIISIVGGAVVLCALATVPFTRNHRGLSFAMAGTDLRDARGEVMRGEKETASPAGRNNR